MLRYFAGKDDVAAMKAAGPPKEYITVRRPLVALIKELSQCTRYRRIYIEKGGFSLRIEQRAEQ
jgi:hypothetical protein